MAPKDAFTETDISGHAKAPPNPSDAPTDGGALTKEGQTPSHSLDDQSPPPEVLDNAEASMWRGEADL
jgi:hypothetical protein